MSDDLPQVRPTTAPATIGALLRDATLADRLAGCAPPGYDCKRLLRECAATLRANAPLRGVSPASLLIALTRVAGLGLSLGPQGEAYLVPRRDRKTGIVECTLMIGRNGWVNLALRTGRVEFINAHVVYKKDKCQPRLGGGFHVDHEPCLDGDPGPIRAAYAIAHFTTGATRGVWMNARDIAAVRAKADENSTAWRDFEAQMVEKAACKRLAKLLAGGHPLVVAAVQAENGTVYDAPLPELEELPAANVEHVATPSEDVHEHEPANREGLPDA